MKPYGFAFCSLLLLAAVALGQDQPDTLLFPDPNTNPPNQQWGKDVTRRVKICRPPCTLKTNTPGPTATVTATATVAVTATPDPFVAGTQSVTCVDDTIASDPGALTITPAARLVKLTVSDPDGCFIAMSETGAVDGRFVWIENQSANFARFANQAGVLVLPHEVHYLESDHTLSLKYDTDTWVNLNANEPSSIMLTLHDLTDAGDIPGAFGAPDECAFVCSSVFGAFPTGGLFISIPGIGPIEVQKQNDPCACLGAGAQSVQVNLSAGATTAADISIGFNAAASGGSSIAIGEDAVSSNSQTVAIGKTATASGANGSIAIGINSLSEDTGTIAIGNAANAEVNSAIALGGTSHAVEDAFAIGPNSDAGGLNSIAIGNTATTNNDADICIGPGATCAGGTVEIGLGQDAAPAGGVCIGAACASAAGQLMFGGTNQELRPAWTSNTAAVSSRGTTPACTDCTDTRGTITVGSGVSTTSCTITFSAAWTNVPFCFAYDETQILFVRVVTTTTQIVMTSALSFSGDTIKYGCPVS